MKNDAVRVRKAELRDLEAMKRLADGNRDALGFVVRSALAEGIKKGWALVATASNGEVIGFVDYRHRRDHKTTLYHICIQQSYRRRGIGRRLIQALMSEAAAAGKTQIRLKSPADIPANAFYKAIAFAQVTTERGRKRDINIWSHLLTCGDGAACSS